MTSDLRCVVNEMLFCWDVAKNRLVVNYRRFMDRFILEDGTDWLSRYVGNYQSILRNIPEERRSQ